MLERLLALFLVSSVVNGCCSGSGSKSPPPPCEYPSVAVLLEVDDMMVRGIYEETQDYIWDTVVPYCDGINAM